MADDELPRSDPARGEGGERAGGPDEGHEHDQPGDPEGPGTVQERTRPDQTAVLPEGDSAGRPPSPATPDGTALLPPAPREPPRWSARAQVPTPGMADENLDEWTEVQPPRRGMLLPVLISVAIVLLAGLIALGIWLGLRAFDSQPAGPTPPATTSPTPAVTTTSTTSPPAAPTTQPATQPATARIPTLSGLSYEDALALLPPNVAPHRIDEPHASIPAGVVIRTNPDADSEVSLPAQIDIIVSSGPPPEESPSPAPSTTTSASPTENG